MRHSIFFLCIKYLSSFCKLTALLCHIFFFLPNFHSVFISIHSSFQVTFLWSDHIHIIYCRFSRSFNIFVVWLIRLNTKYSDMVCYRPTDAYIESADCLAKHPQAQSLNNWLSTLHSIFTKIIYQPNHYQYKLSAEFKMSTDSLF